MQESCTIKFKLLYDYSYNFLGKDCRGTEQESRQITEDTTVVVHSRDNGGLDKNGGGADEEKKVDPEYI